MRYSARRERIVANDAAIGAYDIGSRSAGPFVLKGAAF
jgi:hypothetical protein